jgi:hypothetical protein
MRKLIASTFTSLDGVMQAPGGPTEDPTGNFNLGGWGSSWPWKRLFENGARPCALRLVASKVSTTGVVMSTYVPAGDIQLGSLSQAEPSAKELTRRAKMATNAA